MQSNLNLQPKDQSHTDQNILKNKPPIFIHSLFRSGSTFLFDVFRRSSEDYWCYQEPIHDWPLFIKDKEELLTLIEAPDLRHPKLDKPYFYELCETYDFWRGVLVKEIIYDDYFGSYVPEKTIKYLLSLLAGAKERTAVIQECRTPSRISEIRKRIGGIHIYLWRNPWDQWWSYKVTDYFDTANQLIINAPSHPEIISHLRKEIGFVEFHSNNLNEEMVHFNRKRLSAENSYFVFFTLWILALLEGKTNGDVLINIDSLGDQEQYRKSVLEKLLLFGISSIDFVNCKSPQSVYNDTDKSFFSEIEKRVYDMFEGCGYSTFQLQEISELRKEHQPLLWEKDSSHVPVNVLLGEIDKLRKLTRRFKTREALNEHEYTLQIEQMDQKCRLLFDKLAEREHEIEARQSENERLMKNLAEREHEIEALQSKNEHFTENLDKRERETKVLQSQNEQLMNKLSQHNQEIEALTLLNNAQHAELQEVYASWSWKLTKPLRRLNRLRKNFLRM